MSDTRREFDVRTNAEWEKLGWTAASVPKIEVDATRVPPEFHLLIPYVEQWAISCDVRRGDYYDKQKKEDRIAFHRAVATVEKSLWDWIDTPPFEGAKLQFHTMMKAYGEVGCELAYDERQKKNT
jgi:hypothetical protein